MRYVYVDNFNCKLKCHLLKVNKALAKLQKDAVIIGQVNNTIFIADGSSSIAGKMLED